MVVTVSFRGRPGLEPGTLTVRPLGCGCCRFDWPSGLIDNALRCLPAPMCPFTSGPPRGPHHRSVRGAHSRVARPHRTWWGPALRLAVSRCGCAAGTRLPRVRRHAGVAVPGGRSRAPVPVAPLPLRVGGSLAGRRGSTPSRPCLLCSVFKVPCRCGGRRFLLKPTVHDSATASTPFGEVSRISSGMSRSAHARWRGTFAGRLRPRGTLEGNSRRFVAYPRHTPDHLGPVPDDTAGPPSVRLAGRTRCRLAFPPRYYPTGSTRRGLRGPRRPAPWHEVPCRRPSRRSGTDLSPCQPSAGAPCLE